MTKWRYWPYVGLIVGVALLVRLHFAGKLVEDVNNVFGPQAPAEKLSASKIRFQEVSKSLGLDFYHHYNHPIRNADVKNNVRVLGTMFPAITVGDYDGDGFMDIYISAGERGVPNKLYHNERGERFVDRASELGVADLNQEDASSFSVFADFNRDGIIDLLVTKWGCHQLFYGEGKKSNWHFRDVSDKLGGYCSFPNGIGIADMNRDGLLDIVFGNFLSRDKVLNNQSYHWIIGILNDKIHGGEDHLLFQLPDGRFDVAHKIQFPYNSFTHAVGLTDLNRDGYPDLLFANDLSTNDLFLNRGGGVFQEITASTMPLYYHHYSSMDSEFFDYDQDEWPDLFTTESFKPPFTHKTNVLWKRIPNGGFREVAEEQGVDRCGFAWGAKFADFDLDGEPDLFVVNGRVENETVKSTKDGYSYWYERFTSGGVPLFLRKGYFNYRNFSLSKDFYMSAFERSCMFRQSGGHFDDVTSVSGIDDTYNGRGLALIDYDNDGRVDLAVVNVGGPVLLYHNVSPPQGDWVGFDLDGGSGNRIPFGARLELAREGKTHVVRELFPTNGMKAQSDPRFVIGLGHDKPLEAVVVWPDGKKEKFTGYKINAYNRLVKGQGGPIAL